MIGIAPQEWKTDLPEFCEKTRDFYAGKMDKGSYKGFSGRYGNLFDMYEEITDVSPYTSPYGFA